MSPLGPADERNERLIREGCPDVGPTDGLTGVAMRRLTLLLGVLVRPTHEFAQPAPHAPYRTARPSLARSSTAAAAIQQLVEAK